MHGAHALVEGFVTPEVDRIIVPIKRLLTCIQYSTARELKCQSWSRDSSFQTHSHYSSQPIVHFGKHLLVCCEHTKVICKPFTHLFKNTSRVVINSCFNKFMAYRLYWYSGFLSLLACNVWYLLYPTLACVFNHCASAGVHAYVLRIVISCFKSFVLFSESGHISLSLGCMLMIESFWYAYLWFREDLLCSYNLY